MLLTQKLQELNEISNSFKENLENSKKLINENISLSVEKEVNEKKEVLQDELKAFFENFINEKVQKEVKQGLNEKDLKPFLKEYLKNNPSLLLMLQNAINAFLRDNKQEFKEKAKEQIQALDISEFTQEAKDYVKETVKNFDKFYFDSCLEISKDNEGKLKEFLEEHKEEILSKSDLSFLKTEFLENKHFQKELTNTLKALLNNHFKSEKFDLSLHEKTSLLVKEKVNFHFSTSEVKKMRFQNAISCLAICLQNEITSISNALKSLKELDYYEAKLQNRQEKINNIYEVR